MARPTSYIGVSGVMTSAETKTLVDLYDMLPAHPLRRIAFGSLASEKTLNGLPNRHPAMYPTRENLGAPFRIRPSVRAHALCLVHVSADADRGLEDLLRRAHGYAETDRRVLCDGVQVNVAWPAHEGLLHYRDSYPEARVILQVGPRAFQAAAEIAEICKVPLAEGIWHYLHRPVEDEAITDILLDGSAGTGKPLDLDTLAAIVADMAKRFPDLGIGVAGGLCAETLSALATLLRLYPFLNLDAEGRLQRPDGGLDLNACAAYLDAARVLLDVEGGV